MVNIPLLLASLAVLDVIMICYSLYLDKQVSKLVLPKQKSPSPLRFVLHGESEHSGNTRVGRFERFFQTPIGNLLLAILLLGSAMALKAIEYPGKNLAVPENKAQECQTIVAFAALFQ